MQYVRPQIIWVHMHKKLAAFALSILALTASATPPSTDAIDELLKVTGEELSAQVAQKEFGGAVRAMVYEELKPYKLNEVQEQIAEKLIQSLDAAIEFEFSWKRVHPVATKAYRESFSQEEIIELIAVYRSPNPQRAETKMRRVEQRARELFREQLAPGKARMIQEIRKAIKEIRGAQ